MEGFFTFIIIIAVIVSVISSVTKQNKKTANRPPSTFPPLSVDTPRPYVPPVQENEACEGSQFVSNEGYAASSEELKSMEAVDYTLQEIKISEDTQIENRTPGIDFTIQMPEIMQEYSITANEESAYIRSLKLFEGRDEALKAVIYSEILRPKFKH